ncbi:MAG: hypothetical protein CL748_05725 [Chloroflexi bacterium]|nr:hypothetical protein [Chloroflexota bacterium]|tara:strand:+ start:986 stop:1726 length:741 start_codon:yes stop_codon:yes gene_type:complete
MTIVKRSNQNISNPFDGSEMLLMASEVTGTGMITVADLFVEPGAKSPYHFHDNTEESIFVVEGNLEFRLGSKIFSASSGDCILAPQGIGHGLENIGNNKARLITVYPNAKPNREVLDDVDYEKTDPPPSVFLRKNNEPYEFQPGISRYDMVGDFIGAKSTYISELTFEPGAIAPNHYHPSHEEAMFCLNGNLMAVYAKENGINLAEGDCFTCEIGIRHGIYNASNDTATLLALHSTLNPPPRVDVD